MRSNQGNSRIHLREELGRTFFEKLRINIMFLEEETVPVVPQ